MQSSPVSPSEIPAFRQKYVDLDYPHNKAFDFFQPKFDGIWAAVISGDTPGAVAIYSRTGQLKDSRVIPDFPENTVAFAEFMFGSQWAQQPELKDKLFFFDIHTFKNQRVNSPYSERYGLLQGFAIQRVPNYPMSDLRRFWEQQVVTGNFEGVVYRNYSDKFTDRVYRSKIDLVDDYVIMSMKPGEGKHFGRMGAIEVGQFKNGLLMSVMTVGGGFNDELRQDIHDNFIEKYYLSVCSVVGKARFESGALRHPNFVRFRDDKKPEDCIFPTL